MGFNSAFKGLRTYPSDLYHVLKRPFALIYAVTCHCVSLQMSTDMF